MSEDDKKKVEQPSEQSDNSRDSLAEVAKNDLIGKSGADDKVVKDVVSTLTESRTRDFEQRLATNPRGLELTPAQELLSGADPANAEAVAKFRQFVSARMDVSRVRGGSDRSALVGDAPVVPGNPAAATQREGQFDGPDGSKITFAKCDDGQVRPVGVTFKDGTSCAYKYEGNKVVEITNFGPGPEKKEQSRIISENGGESFKFEYKDADGTYKPVDARNKDGQEAQVSVRPDGTWQYSSPGFNEAKPGQQWERKPDGTLTMTARKEDGSELRTVEGPGRQRVLYEKFEGNMRPLYAELQDGTGVVYQYDKGQPKAITVTTGGRSTEYSTTDGGKSWTEKGTGRVGAIELKDGFAPEFKPTGERRDVPAEREKPPEQMSPAELEKARALGLQQRLSVMVDALYQPRLEEAKKQAVKDAEEKAAKEGKTATKEQIETAVKEAQQKLLDQMTKDKNDLKQEMDRMREAKDPNEAWKTCTTSHRVYKDLVRWMEDTAIPAHMKQILGNQGREVPPGSPQTVPTNERGFFMDPVLFRTRAANGELPKPDLAIAGTKPGDTTPPAIPGEREVMAVSRGLSWLSDAQKQMERERKDYELNVAMPEIIRANGLPPKWLEEVGRDPESKLPALREMVQLATTARNYASAMAIIGTDKIGLTEFPPGCKPEYDSNGKLVKVNMDLPKDLDMQNPENLKKIEDLRKWLEKNGEKLDRAIEAYASSRPENSVFYGEIEMKAKVGTNAKGETEVFDPKDPRQAGRQGSDMNLLSCGYTVRNENGKIYVDYQVQPKQSEFYNYLNIGASDVGKPFVSTKGPYEPNDPVAIKDASGKTKLVLAKDLEAERAYQKVAYWGEKALTLTMDVGMAAASLGTGGAAFAAGNVWKVATSAARFGLAASGFFLNNAWARTDETWSKVGEVRGVLMVLDVTQGTVRHLGGAGLKFLAGAGEAAVAADKLAEAAKASNWLVRNLWRAGKVGEVAMEVANVPYAPIVISDINKQLKVLNEIGQGNPYERAARMVQDGRDIALKPLSPEEKKAQEVAAAKQQLDLYTEQLTRGKDEQSQKQIRDILQRAKEALEPNCPPEKREQLRRDMLDLIYGDKQSAGQKIANTQSTNNRDMAGEQIRVQRGDGVASPETRAAAAAALLFMDRDKKSPSDVYASRDIKIPAHTRGSGEDAYTEPEKTVQQTLTRNDLMEMLKTDVLAKDNVARRVVSGDMLVRAGERPPIAQAAILRDVLSDPNSTKADKLNAILQLGPMANALDLLSKSEMSPSDKQNFLAQTHGVTPRDLENTLRKTAENPSEKEDVRAAAAAMLHILRSNFKPEDVARATQQLGRDFVAANGDEAAFRKQVVDRLNTQKDDANPLTRLRASITLRELGNLGGMTDNLTYNQQLMRSLDRNNPQISAAVLAELVIKDPSKDLSPQDRTKVLALLREPLTKESAALKELIVSRIGDFAVTPAERTRVRGDLERMLTAGDDQHARLHPELRVAAVNGLAQLSEAGSIPLLKQVAMLANESDARVRMAAVGALQRLHADNLNAFVLDALKTETDPTIRAKLTNMESQTVRPIRDRNYDRQVQAVQAALGEATQNNWNDPAAMEWLKGKSEFSLLTAAGYEAEYKARVENGRDLSTSQWWTNWGSDWSDLKAGQKLPLEQDRIKQIYALKDVAAQNTDDGHKARMVLMRLVMDPGGMGISDKSNTAEANAQRHDQVRAAAAAMLRDLCAPGSAVRGELLKGMRQAIEDEKLSPEARGMLVDGLSQFVENVPTGPSRALEAFMANPNSTKTEDVLKAYKDAGITVPRVVEDALRKYQSDPKTDNLKELTKTIYENSTTSSALYRQIASVTLARALENQARQLSQDPTRRRQEMNLQNHMIEALVRYQYRDAYPVLEAYAKSHPDALVKAKAEDAISQLRDRISSKWENTKPHTGTEAERASQIDYMLRSGDVDDLTQALITGYKGLPITNASDSRVLLYQRALREGGAANDRARPGETAQSAIDGTPKVRLAAAMVILDRNEKGEYVNKGFTDADRREALKAVLMVASERPRENYPKGYVDEANAILARELPKVDPALLNVGLRDLILANPAAADRTLTVGGKQTSLRQLWNESFRGESVTETMPDGSRIVTRRFDRDLVVEHLKGNEVIAVVPPKGKTYADVLNSDLWTRNLSTPDKLAVATRLLTDAKVAATEAQKNECLQTIASLASSAKPEDRLAFARYMLSDGPVAGDVNNRYRQQTVEALTRLAASAEAPIKEQAEALLHQQGEADRGRAIKAAIAIIDGEVRRAAQWNDAARNATDLSNVPPKYREQTEAYFRAIQPAAQQQAEVNKKVVENAVAEMVKLSKQGNLPADAQAAMLENYSKIAGILGKDNQAFKDLQAQLGTLLGQMKDQNLPANDPRRAAISALLRSGRSDEFSFQVAEAMLSGSGLPKNDSLRWEAVRYAAINVCDGSKENSDRARRMIFALPTDDKEANDRVRRLLIEGGSSARYGDQDAQARFFSTLADYSKHAGYGEDDEIYKRTSEEARRRSPEGQRVDTDEAFQQRLKEAEDSKPDFMARRNIEQWLDKRAKEKGEDDLPLAKARLRYVEYMRTKPGANNHYRDMDESRKQCEAAIKTLESKAPGSNDLADAYRALAGVHQRYPGFDPKESNRKAEENLARAATIYGGDKGDRQKLITCLGELGTRQALNGKPQEAIATLNNLSKLLEGADNNTRAQIMASGFSVLRPLTLDLAKTPEAKQLAMRWLEESKKLDLSKLSNDQALDVSNNLWWVSENMRKTDNPRDAIAFFEHTLALIEKPGQTRDGSRYSDLLAYYGDYVVKPVDAAKAREIADRVAALRRAAVPAR